MKKLTFLITTLSLLAFIACSADQPKHDIETLKEQKEVVINYQLSFSKEFKGKDIIVSKGANNQIVPMDTLATGKKGQWVLSITDPNFYQFKVSDDNYIWLFLAAGDQFNLTATLDSIQPTTTIEGSDKNANLIKFFADEVVYSEKQGKLQESIKNGADANLVQKEMEKNYLEWASNLKLLIQSKPGYPSTLLALKYMNQESDIAFYAKVSEGMNQDYPNSTLAKQLSQNVAALTQQAEQKAMAASNPIVPGKPAPELSYPTPEGPNFALSSLKGHYVLIDFWASWCGPCRRENPNVVKMYNKYHEKGFEILSVSLDQKKDRWLQAIQQDGLNWHHISDLKGWKAEGAAKYGVTSIPFTVLVDPNGNIVQTNLRGHDLEAVLQKIYGF